MQMWFALVICLLLDCNLVLGQNVETFEVKKEANRGAVNKVTKCSEEGPECQEHTIKCCGSIPCKSNLGINFIPVTDPTFTPAKLQSTTPTPITPTQDPKCKGPKCLNYRCVKDPQLLGSDGNILEDTSIFSEVSTICGKTYGFSKISVPMDSAFRLCCSFGMRLLSIDSVREFLCLSARMEKEPKNTQLYTSGKDEDCEGKFGWCTSGECISEDIPWTNTQPDNFRGREHCVALVKFGRIGLNDVPCSDNRQFICESISPPAIGPFFNETACPITKPS